MKLFVAVEVPDTVRGALAKLPDVVGAEGWRLTAPSLLHVTMRFLGDVPPERLDDLKRALDVVAARHAPFTLRLEGVGTFGNARHPRVLWAGVHDDDDDDDVTRPLLALANDIDASIDPVVADVVGARDRPFAAHITLGRTRAKPGKRQRDRVQPAKVAHPVRAADVGPLTMSVEELVLFDSAPSPLAYTPVWRGKLGGGSHAADSTPDTG